MRIPAPYEGLNTSQVAQDQSVATSPSMQNCRPFDVAAEKVRVGQRAGTKKAFSTRISGNFAVIRMVAITTTYIQPEA